MRSYLFIGGGKDGLCIPLADEPGATEKETYVRETLSVGDASIYIYRHESLTPEQVLNLLIESYKAWCVNRPAVAAESSSQSRNATNGKAGRLVA
jgi:hypothetical protein